VDFWGAVVRDVLPAGRENPPATFVSDGALQVHLDLPGAELDATATARVRTPSGDVVIVPMDRTDADTFGASVPLAEAGAYWVAVTVANPDGSQITSSSGAVSAYEEEFAFREPDPTLGADIVELTAGRLDPDPSAVFDPAPIRGRAEVSIWPWLVGAALLLFLADVALRRLVLSVGDADAWKEGLTTARTKEKQRIEKRIEEAEATGAPPPTLSESETLERLMRRKRGR
jgi:Ca-activated chloride channel homolog